MKTRTVADLDGGSFEIAAATPIPASDALPGFCSWSIQQSDCLEWLRSLPSNSVDLVFTSPPYELARHYLENGKNLGIARKTEAWVAWLVEVITECSRVCTGLVAFVVEGQTKNYRYSAGPLLLAADLHRAGFNLRKPAAFARIGIPGSGGPDWLRNDWEPIVCVTRPGKLPWSDNTACGHPPKWAPGAMSHRVTKGTRVNQWGKPGTTATGNKEVTSGGKPRPSHIFSEPEDPHEGQPTLIDFHERPQGVGTCGRGADIETKKGYEPPARANPGNVIRCSVGGGRMGHPLAHSNEAPFPLALAEFFVRSFCPPGGIVADPFSGSATTGHASILHGRRFVGCDLRESQAELGRNRLASITPMLPGFEPDLFAEIDHAHD